MSHGEIGRARHSVKRKEYTESPKPSPFPQGTFATPSPSIAERAKCFGSIRTGSTTKRADSSVTREDDTWTSIMTTPVTNESDPICPVNIVATRRVLFSPAKTASTNSKSRSITRKTQCHDNVESHSPTSDKENTGEGKAKMFGDIQSVKLREVAKSFMFSDAPAEKANSGASSDMKMDSEELAQEVEQKGIVEKRTIWLQGKIGTPNNAITLHSEEKPTIDIKESEESAMNNIVAARTLLLQKNLLINTVATNVKSPQRGNNNFNLSCKKVQSPRESGLVGKLFDACADDKKKSPTRSMEARKRKKTGKKKASKPKTLVETRAQWLEKQVTKNEMCGSISSEDDDDDEELEKPKTDIQLRLEALQKEMMAVQLQVTGGVAPKRSLAELP